MRKCLPKIFLAAVIVFPAIFFFTRSVKSFLNTYPAFKIKKIATSYQPPVTSYQSPVTSHPKTEDSHQLQEEDIKKILNIDEQTSIFFLDLKEASQKLEQKAEIKKAVVGRQFPDKLIIQLEKRIPSAQIHSGKYFLVDEEGVILPEPKNFSFSNFPLVKGIKLLKGEIKIGKRCSSQQLNNALALIKFLSLFPEFKIKEIDAENIQDISLYFQVNSPNLPLWLGKSVLLKIKSSPWDNEEKDVLREKIRLLSEILSFHQPQDVKYIDLRFEDIMVRKR